MKLYTLTPPLLLLFLFLAALTEAAIHSGYGRFEQFKRDDGGENNMIPCMHGIVATSIEIELRLWKVCSRYLLSTVGNIGNFWLITKSGF